MVDDESGRRKRGSGVLDAIFQAVEDKPESAQQGASPFRASALANLDVPVQVDNLLPITSRRTWLAVVGVALVIVAFLGYAAATTKVSAVYATGRAVGAGGVAQVVSAGAGVLTEVMAGEQAPVRAGAAFAHAVGPDGRAFDVLSPITGQVWQSLVLGGGTVLPGTAIATVLPEGSDQSVLVAMDEAAVASITEAERIDVSLASGEGTTATLVSISTAPVPADVAAARTGEPLAGDGLMSMVVLQPKTALPAGAEVQVSFVLSESTLLKSMLGIS